jgi:NAD(P)-dependent dehydrogenase (short-subunit alcohol dehydrogenase family)
MDLGINNKIAVVTGSYRGTGLIIGQHLGKEGARVIFHGINEADATKLAAQLGKAVDPADIVWGDISTEAGSTQVINAVKKLTDRVDILVNNYGTAAPGRWQSSSTEDWIDAYQRNALAGLRMIQGFSPMMRQQGWGRIVHLGTVGSTRPNKVSPQYYAAKGALANMNVGLAQELSDTGITVNLVSPGLIRTAEVEQAYLAKAVKAGWGDTFEAAETMIVKEYAPNPLGRMATREEVADVVVFVCSQRASFINGQNIRVDGGALGIVQ